MIACNTEILFIGDGLHDGEKVVVQLCRFTWFKIVIQNINKN